MCCQHLAEIAFSKTLQHWVSIPTKWESKWKSGIIEKWLEFRKGHFFYSLAMEKKSGEWGEKQRVLTLLFKMVGDK